MTTARLILVTKFKGGSGATHVASLLAHGLGETEPTAFADYEPQGDGAQVLGVLVEPGTGTVADFFADPADPAASLIEIPTSPLGFYLAPHLSLTRPTGLNLCSPDRLRAAAQRAGLAWIIVDSVKLPSPATAAFVRGADLVLHVQANAVGLRTLAHADQQLRRHAQRGQVHTVFNHLRKDASEAALLADVAATADSRGLHPCPVRIGHDGWVAYALRNGRSPFSIGNARTSHRAAADLAAWVRTELPTPPVARTAR
ncbi:cellulose biosynthesis protein BcsQ [Crossiella equi]|uniref:Cellulose biosynthesis protein BcsQ n=1 Tax=Crossiella equi TaxID=130796 RepID=A0ABS5AM62_9PSEU|nr:hypothetical protein [Crossiella equi]MBP2477658.1 cellulose biosynthesis protein BcsQ [Crossiella equi]